MSSIVLNTRVPGFEIEKSVSFPGSKVLSYITLNIIRKKHKVGEGVVYAG